MTPPTAANDNSLVRMSGGGNTKPTMAMLERFHDEIVLAANDRFRSKTPGARFVYVIGEADPEYIKIGKASNVLSRMRSLQTGNHSKLYVHRVFEFEKTNHTTKVEAWAHEDAGRNFTRGVGEWFRCGAVEAHNLITEICKKEIIRCHVKTPKIEEQWKLDEPIGRKHLAEKEERMRKRLEESGYIETPEERSRRAA